jgi:HipA-like protein
MIKKFIHKIWKSEGQEDIATPANQNAEFVLMYKELSIGVLSIKEGEWKFSYTDEFRQQKEIAPLIDFPSTGKEYRSSRLWPFFSYRIPGLNQPKVQEIMRAEHIQNNEVALLKKFGTISVYNPFLLKPSL